MAMNDEENRAFVAGKRGSRMHDIDKLPADIRLLIHEYGYTIVKTLMDCGVTKPNRIKHIVETVLNEFSPTRGTYSIQGIRKNIDTGVATDPKL